MGKKKLPKLTPPEFEIMDAVWDSGELTVTEIMKVVNSANEKDLTRSTIQVQIARLEEKGWLKHRGNGGKFLFSATVPRGEASAAIVQDMSQRVFGGSCVELVKTLFKSSEISSDEIKKLRKLIDKYEEKDI